MASVSCTSSCVAAPAIQVTATLTVTAGSQSVSGNYTTINYSYKAVRNNYGFTGTTRTNVGTLEVWINGSRVKSVAVGLTNDGDGGNTECSGSDSVNVGHNSDGTKSFSYQVKIIGGTDPRGANYQWNSSASSAPSMSLAAIPRATQPSMSASSVTMGNAITINTPRASSSFTHSLWYQVNGGDWHDIASGVETSYSWAVPISLASSVPNGTSISVTVICRTYNGSTNLGDKYTSFTANVPSSVVPSMGTPTASRVDNGAPSGWGVYVKGYSKVTIAMTSVSGSYGSTIKSYSITGPNLSSTSSSATSGVLGSSGTNTYTCTITDSRGRTATKTVSISVVDYSKPSISVSASRCNSDGTVSSSGTYLRVTASYSIASVSSKNSVSSRSVSCNGASNTSFSSGSAFVLGANCAINTSYTLTASVKDALNNTASASITIPTASRIMNVRANKSGIAFGKFAESDNVFDSGWNIRIPAGYSNVDHSVPVAGDVSDIVKSVETIKNAKSVLGSAVMDGTWYGLISARHRNGSGDGTEYGLYLRSLLTSSGNLIWGKQYGARSWQSERIILDSLNYDAYLNTGVKDIGNSSKTTFAYSKAGLDYNAFTYLAAWNGHELRAVNKTELMSTGTGNNWIYWKFSNGMMIMVYVASKTTPSLSSWGSMYSGALPQPPAYPVAFSEVPFVTCQLVDYGDSKSNGWIASRLEGTDGGTTQCPSFQYIRPTNYADSVRVCYTAIGRWK